MPLLHATGAGEPWRNRTASLFYALRGGWIKKRFFDEETEEAKAETSANLAEKEAEFSSNLQDIAADDEGGVSAADLASLWVVETGDVKLARLAFPGFVSTRADATQNASHMPVKDPELMCETLSHQKVLAPVALLWQKLAEAQRWGGRQAHDPAVGPSFTDREAKLVDSMSTTIRDYLFGWVQDTLRIGEGCKPASIVPAASSWPSGRTDGTFRKSWARPGCDRVCRTVTNTATNCSFELCDSDPPTHVFPHDPELEAALLKIMVRPPRAGGGSLERSPKGVSGNTRSTRRTPRRRRDTRVAPARAEKGGPARRAAAAQVVAAHVLPPLELGAPKKWPEPRFLEPVYALAQLVRTAKAWKDDSDFVEPDFGTPFHAAELAEEAVAAAAGLHAVLLYEVGALNQTGDADFDAHVAGYARFCTFGAGGAKEAEREPSKTDELDLAPLARLEKALSYDWELSTSEVPFTDSLYEFHRYREMANLTEDERDAMRNEPPAVLQKDVDYLSQTLTGDASDGVYGPTNAVRWMTPPRDFAALVLRHGFEDFAAHVYHFGDGDRNMGCWFLRLQPGSYHLHVEILDADPTIDDDWLPQEIPFQVAQFGDAMGEGAHAMFSVPPRRPVLLTVSRGVSPPSQAPTRDPDPDRGGGIWGAFGTMAGGAMRAVSGGVEDFTYKEATHYTGLANTTADMRERRAAFLHSLATADGSTASPRLLGSADDPRGGRGVAATYSGPRTIRAAPRDVAATPRVCGRSARHPAASPRPGGKNGSSSLAERAASAGTSRASWWSRRRTFTRRGPLSRRILKRARASAAAGAVSNRARG